MALLAWFVEFNPKNELIIPAPLAPKPIELLLLVQLKIVLGIGPLGSMVLVKSPKQRVWLLIGLIVGIGFTIRSKLMLDPWQVTPLFV